MGRNSERQVVLQVEQLDHWEVRNSPQTSVWSSTRRLRSTGGGEGTEFDPLRRVFALAQIHPVLGHAPPPGCWPRWLPPVSEGPIEAEAWV